MEKKPDHEAEMAKAELANCAKNAVALYKMIERESIRDKLTSEWELLKG